MRYLLLLSLLALSGCGKLTREPIKSGKPIVAVNNDPVRYFAERIGGDAIELRFPVPATEDPEFWKPTEKDIREFQKADLILLNGAGYGKWIANASLPMSSSVDTSAAFKDKLIKIEDGVTHSHGPAGEHTHSGIASNTWLDFRLALEQATAVRNALARQIPGMKAEIDARFATLEADLKKLDSDLEAVIAPAKTRPVLGSHPVFQYLERRHGLKMKSVHWEADAVPGDDEMKELQKILKDHPAKWMIWEDEPNPKAVEKLKALSISSVVFKPSGNKPEEGDFLTQMRKNIESVKPAFAP